MSYYDFNDHFWSHREVGGGQVLSKKSQEVSGTGGLTKILTGWLFNRRDRAVSQLESAPMKNSLERTP